MQSFFQSEIAVQVSIRKNEWIIRQHAIVHKFLHVFKRQRLSLREISIELLKNRFTNVDNLNVNYS